MTVHAIHAEAGDRAIPAGLSAALDYAAAGLAVFPCKRDKAPLTGRGFHDASSDPAVITEWWRRWPDALVGLPTTPANGIAVLDLDVDKATGEPVGEDEARRRGWLDMLGTAPSAKTPSGGRHFYLRHPGPSLRRKIRAAPGIDLLGDGGYVVAPGAGGYAWEWLGLSELGRADLPAMPREILSAAQHQNGAQRQNGSGFEFDTGRGDDAELLDLLRSSPNNLDRNDWVKLCCALKHVLGEAGRGAWLDFSARYSGSVADGEAERVWTTARPNGSAGGGSIVHLLRSDRSAISRRDRPRTERLEPVSGDAAPEAEPLSFTTTDQLHGRAVPPRKWLVPELIPSSTVTMLSGDGGTGKSLLALQLAVALAAGRQWLARPMERPGNVLFLSAEDDADELHRRLSDIAIAEGIALADLRRLAVRSLAGEDALLALLDRKSNALAETPLYHALDAAMAAQRPALLVLDTLADLHSGEENSRAHARQFVGILRGLAIRHGCAVLLLAHPSLTGMSSGSGLSGSTAWNASVRSRLYLDRIREGDFEPDPDARRLTTKKANYGRTGSEIGLKWKAGVFVADASETGLDRLATGAKAQRVFMSLLHQFTGQGRYVSASPGPTYAPAIFAGHPDAEGCTKRALKGAMNELFGADRIINATHGSGAKARSHIAAASEAAV